MARYTVTHKGSEDPIAYPGVTTITGLIDKSAVLMKWAVKMMLLWLHKNWIHYVCEEVKALLTKKNSNIWIEFESKEDYFKMLEDAKDHYEEVSDEAKIVGICVHDLIHEYIKTEIKKQSFDTRNFIGEIAKRNKLPDNLQETVKKRFNKSVAWFNDNVIEFLETEQSICSKKYGFCGTLDILAELKPNDDKDNLIVGGLYILDIKSSKGFYDGQGKQAAGYKIGREEGGDFHLVFKDDNDKENIIIEESDVKLDPIKIDGIGILTTNFKDTGEVKFKDYSDLCMQKEIAFLKLLDFYYHDKNRRLKNNPFILKAKDVKKK